MSILRFLGFFNGLGVITVLLLGSSVLAQPTTNPNVPEQQTPLTPEGTTTNPTGTPSTPGTTTNPTGTPSTPGTTTNPTEAKPPTTNLTPEELKSLLPSSDLLLRPSKPNEVEIKINKKLTLKEAVELGLKNNRDLQTGIVNVEVAKAQIRQAQAGLLPTLNLQFQLDRTRSSNADLQNGITNAENASQISITGINNRQFNQFPIDINQFTGQLQLNYNLYTGGGVQASIAKAEEQLKFNLLDVERLTEQTQFNVSKAYYDLQNADAQVEIAKASVDDANETLRDAQLLFKAGLGTRYDVLSAEVTLATNQQNLVTALANQVISRKLLAQVIGVGQTVELTTADEIVEVGDWKFSLEESIVKAYTNRSELDQQLVQKEIYRQASVVALASIRPQVSLFANYSILEQFGSGSTTQYASITDPNTGLPVTKPYSVDYNGFGQGYSFGAKFNWEFYDGGAAAATADQNYHSMHLADIAFAKERETIRASVEQDYLTLKSSKENINTAKKNIELATEALRLARLRFQAGVGTQTDVINSQTQLTTARSQFVQAIIGYNQAYNSLQRNVSRVYSNTTNDNINNTINNTYNNTINTVNNTSNIHPDNPNPTNNDNYNGNYTINNNPANTKQP